MHKKLHGTYRWYAVSIERVNINKMSLRKLKCDKNETK